jgi:hypothetical protein
MSELGVDLRAELLGRAAVTAIVGGRVHEGHVPETYSGAYIWIGRGAVEHDRVIDQAAGEDPFREFWDLECHSRDLDEAQDLAALARGLDSHRGQFGDGSVQAVFVGDHADDYVPRGLSEDELGTHVAALSLEIVGYEPAVGGGPGEAE